MFIGYNLSRCISVIGMEEFIKALKKCCLAVFLIKIRLILRRFRRFLEKNVKLILGKMKNFYTVKPFLFNPKDLYLYVNWVFAQTLVKSYMLRVISYTFKCLQCEMRRLPCEIWGTKTFHRGRSIFHCGYKLLDKLKKNEKIHF